MGRAKVLIVGLSALLASCGSSSQGAGTNSAISDSSAVAQKDLPSDSSLTNAADDIVATSVDGKSFSLREALTDSPVVLWFWAPG